MKKQKIQTYALSVGANYQGVDKVIFTDEPLTGMKAVYNNIEELTDQSPMPLGKYKGTAMVDVPAEYLIWYRQNAKSPNKPLMDYIIDNWQAIQKESCK